MTKVGLQVMSTVLLPLLCGSCATQSGILYGSRIELEAGSGLGFDPSVTVDEVGLFFSGNFGRIGLGQEDGAELRRARREAKQSLTPRQRELWSTRQPRNSSEPRSS
jgi:hypothetical protein